MKNRNNCADKLVCVDSTPEKPWKLFFGDNGNFIRIDKCDYHQFQKLYEKAFSDFWTHKVIDFSKDNIGWERLPDNAKRMFLLNNDYQALMDSGVTNLFSYLSQICTNSELSILYKYNDQNESIHALTYSYGLSQMFGGDAEEKLNLVYTDEKIKSRLQSETEVSTDFIKYVIKDNNTDHQAKVYLLKEIFSTYFLESVKFPFSFLVTWKINEGYKNAIQGFAQLLKLIAHDELTTHSVTHNEVIKILRNEERQEFSEALKEVEEWIYDYYKFNVNQEIGWVKYLFKDGPISSLTEEMAIHFIKYQADKSLKLMKLQPIFNEEHSELISWFERYRNLNNQNAALQEVSNSVNRKGIIKNDLDRLDKYKGVLNGLV